MRSGQRRQPSTKYLNQLAFIQERIKIEREERELHQKLKYKIKSVNHMAQSDNDFYPDLPGKDKGECGSTCINENSINSLLPIEETTDILVNPQDHSDLNEKDQSNLQDNKCMEKSIIIRIGNEYFNEETLQYCYDCDSRYPTGSQHICSDCLVSLNQIDKKLNQLSKLSEIALIDKFAIFINTAMANCNSQILRSTLMILKGDKNITFTLFELVIKKRLINLMSKKIGMVLELEDNE